MIQVLVLDDHPLVRKAVAERVVLALGPCEVTQADSLGKALEFLARRTFDLLVVDVMLVDGCGLALTHGDGAPVVAFTMLDKAEVKARNPGSRLFASVGKHEDPVLLDQAMRQALKKEVASAVPRVVASLSHNEQEMLQSLLKGRRLADIAKEKGVGASTVQSYKNRMLAKLGLKTHHELLTLAAKKGWL